MGVGRVAEGQVHPADLSRWLGADVRSLTTERIGDGLVGMNLRLVPRYGEPTAGLPASVVVKLPSDDETSRQTGIALRNYEREVKFYLHLASTVDIRTPHCFHAEWDEGTGDFVLLLEDLAPARQGDQVAGCDMATARRAVVELAGLHAPRWDDPSLAEVAWLQRREGGDDSAQLEALYAMFLPGFLQTYGRRLDEESTDLVQRFAAMVRAWSDGREPPYTVVHGDYRLDNLLFGEGARGVAVVDWQTPGHGPGIGDLSYFCGAGLLPAERRVVERDLVEAYAAEMDARRIAMNDGWLWEQYRREAFGGVIMTVVASQIVARTARSEEMFAAMGTRHLRHAVDLDSAGVV